MVELTETTTRSWEEVKAITLERLKAIGLTLPEDVDKEAIEGVILIYRQREMAKELGLPENSDVAEIGRMIKKLNKQEKGSGDRIFTEIDERVRKQFEEFFSWKG